MWLWWLILGFVIGLIGMLPVVRLLLRRAEYRARQAERHARNNERLAELGSMTSGLAHEIKNPLSTIGLNAQLLAESIDDTDLPAEEKQRLHKRIDALRREVERLSGILGDFLQFAGRMQLDPQRHDLCEVVSGLADFYLPQAEQARVMLRVDTPASGVFARIDEGLFKQALLNLMINATQAIAGVSRPTETGPAGELILRVERRGDRAVVRVTDTGPGIEADRQENVFHPYVSSKSGGTGLGLPTTKRIVEEHGGRITLDSEPGRGTAFSIDLPAV